MDDILNHIRQNYIGLKTSHGEIVRVDIDIDGIIVLFIKRTIDKRYEPPHSFSREIQTFYGVDCDWDWEWRKY